MHELSIARSLVRVCEDAAREQRAHRVSRVYLKLGPLSGVVRESLEFAYDFATEGTLLAGSELVIETVPVIAACDHCDFEGPLPDIHKLRCPECGAPTPNLVSGRDLLVRAIDYDETNADDPTLSAGPSASPSAEAAPPQPQP